ncbi:alkaline phosphatase family protein [Haloferula sp. BvORR071]|uniref:alkaline phosphatase family protein n=1 Tax=Haloferula sp. BvORR071 TaxID=1396141 RepID=UPI0022410565|nr:alkaline phosphatase family protein [Haloferula sp. BvORR071]
MSTTPAPAPTRKRLLLVGWDSADWKIIHPMLDRGELPALQSLIEGGISGNLATLEPQLSPMLWTSIASGKMAYHHGVAGFTEVDPNSSRVVPVSATTRKCKVLWEMLGERGLKNHVVGWFATQGERDLNGCMVSNLHAHLKDVEPDQDPADWPPPPPGTYWPPELAADLDELRVSPHEIDPEQILRLFVPLAHEVDQSKDQRLALLAERLAEAYSVQAAATWLLEHRPDWDFMAVYFRAIDEISHIFMPYHPPRMESVPERDFAIYQNVVAMAYRAHDLMLQRLLDLAGPDTAVMLVSDHGFHSDHLRPAYTPNVPAGITVWHRPQGVLVASGEGFRKDSLVHGARLLDIAPTILHWFGLPVGADMEGRVLQEAFEESRPVEAIPTWEDSGKVHRQAATFSAAESQALLDQFVKLGYIDEISTDAEQAAADTRRENSWNLARACIYGGRWEEALPLLEDCHHGFPERSDHAQLLARCQLVLGLLDEAERTTGVALANVGHRGGARLIQAYIALERKQPAHALKLLEQVREEDPDAPLLLNYLSQAYLALRKWPEAEECARKILATNPAEVQGHLALARCQLHAGRAEEAAAAAMDAVAHDYANPRGHFLLGSALLHSGDLAHAETALRNAVQIGGAFDLASACRMLAYLERLRGVPAGSSDWLLRSRAARKDRDSGDTARINRLREEIAARQQARATSLLRPPLPTAIPIHSGLELLIVSGLPRSGTSLMMQILEAGGIEPMTDGLREADSDNPAGYYEWEAIKSLPSDPHLIAQTQGKAVKVISALLPHLPPTHRYKLIFMTRPVEQIARSQQTMIRHRGETEASDPGSMQSELAGHSNKLLSALRLAPAIDLLEIPYPDLVADPAPWLAKLADFLPLPFDAGKAGVAVRSDLFRNR